MCEIHVLNGDALKEKFSISENTIICREALIDGPADADDQDGFWRQRSEFIASKYQTSEQQYFDFVITEYQQLVERNPNKINLWFEHDLFCQVNLWFTISYIHKNLPQAEVHLVIPGHDNDDWSGFGQMTSQQLALLYTNKLILIDNDKRLALALWNAYRRKDFKSLLNLSNERSRCFPRLKAVCDAEIERHSLPLNRPQRVLKSTMASGVKDFDTIFQQFQRTEGVYGFGDAQVRHLLSKIM